MDPIRDQIQGVFADAVGLPPEQVFGEPLTLGELMMRAPALGNSVDLMEAFARTCNAVRKTHGVRVRLPAYPLATPVSEVLDAFMDEVVAAKLENA
jgi:hypothetical protein